MATDRQIQANAAKSTGPRTPQGKRTSSHNAARHRVIPKQVLKGQSLHRLNDLTATLTHQFQPTNPRETSLIQTMALTELPLVRIRTTQTTAFQAEMDRLNNDTAAGTGAILAAAFRSLAGHSRAFVQQHRLEVIYDRQFNQALSKLLKLQKTRVHENFQTFSKQSPTECPSGPISDTHRDLQ